MSDYLNKCTFGDVRAVLRQMIADGVKVNCIVTSPPYWGLRSYLPADHSDKLFELGSEPTLQEFVKTMAGVFDLAREVLVDDGTLWMNMGDSYASGGRSTYDAATANRGNGGAVGIARPACADFKPKDLMGQPWRLAFALQDAGWWLRQDIIWCLSGGAWVYARTQKGDMPVMVKDLVRLDPKTVSLWNGERWTRVLGWGPSNDESVRLELVLRSGERIGCTGGHQWPTQRGNVLARELRIGDQIATCRLPEPAGAYRPAHLTDDALWLCGLYLAEGSDNGSARQLSLHIDELPCVDRIKAVARHYGGTCTHTVDGNNLGVRLYGRMLHAVLDTYIGGAVAVDCHLKNAAWTLPDEALRLIVQGYLDGDGHNDVGNDRWRLGFCRNYALERDLRTAAARLGATLTLRSMTSTYQGGEVPAFRGEWRWERSGHWNEKDRGEVMEIRASRARHFWDIAVEDEPHLFALASGVLTHNCKPNPMPESIRDRCTKSHEYIFLLSKSERYYFDQAAILEPVSLSTHARLAQNVQAQIGSERANGGAKTNGNMKAVARGVGWGHGTDAEQRERGRVKNNDSFDDAMAIMPSERNKRSVWTVPTESYKGAHFATFPTKLIEPCILAGCPPGGVVLDPFFGSGTSGQVAQALGRKFIGIELNREYEALQFARLQQPSLDLEAA